MGDGGHADGGRAAARRTALKLPCAIRVGPNEVAKKFWAENAEIYPQSGSGYILECGYIPKSGYILDKHFVFRDLD